LGYLILYMIKAFSFLLYVEDCRSSNATTTLPCRYNIPFAHSVNSSTVSNDLRYSTTDYDNTAMHLPLARQVSLLVNQATDEVGQVDDVVTGGSDDDDSSSIDEEPVAGV